MKRAAGGSGDATIRDVARACGFSVATVSRTLQFPGQVRPGTRALVEATIRQLGYVPNAQARKLRTARSGLVIALVPDITNPFFGGVIRGIEALARAENYAVLLGDTDGEEGNEQRFADMVSGREADGIITLLPRLPRLAARPGARAGSGPIVNICEIAPGGGVGTIRVDNRAASAEATRHLIGLGHRRLAHLGGPAHSPLGVERAAGFRAALMEAGIRPEPALMLAGGFALETGAEGVEQVLARAPETSGFVCASDEIAIGALAALAARGVGVPARASVIGFDDLPVSRYLTPALSTIAQPCEALGGEAMCMLLERIRTPDAPIRHLVLGTTLTVRGTSGPAP